MKNEEFASARHFSTLSSHFYARLSQTYAEYPRYFEGVQLLHTFAPSNSKKVKR